MFMRPVIATSTLLAIAALLYATVAAAAVA